MKLLDSFSLPAYIPSPTPHLYNDYSGINGLSVNNSSTNIFKVRQSRDYLSQKSLLKESFQQIHREKKLKEQILDEQFKNNMQRIRQKQIEKFEFITRQTGSNLSNLRSRVETDLRKSKTDNQLGIDKFGYGGSLIEKELRDTMLYGLKTKMH